MRKTDDNTGNGRSSFIHIFASYAHKARNVAEFKLSLPQSRCANILANSLNFGQKENMSAVRQIKTFLKLSFAYDEIKKKQTNEIH